MPRNDIIASVARIGAMIAYIPARGGSKRVPRKNVRPLGGVPVVARVIGHLRRLRFLTAVCVSTDDDEIARTARAAGAEVLAPRHPRLADDHADFATLLRQDVPRYLDHYGIPRTSAEILFVLPTAALVTPKAFERGFRAFRRSKAGLLVPVLRLPKSPFRSLVRRPNGSWSPLFPRMLSRRSQDLPPAFIDAGLFYYLRFADVAGRGTHWLRGGAPFDCLEMPADIAVDVDTPADWAELERRFRQGLSKEARC